jgi:hypothetical protein
MVISDLTLTNNQSTAYHAPNSIHIPSTIVTNMSTLGSLEAGLARAQYHVQLSVAPATVVYLEVQFTTGSHVRVQWVPSGSGQICQTTSAGSGAPAYPGSSSPNVTAPTYNGGTVAPCIFPFWYGGVIYYGCTDFSAQSICATSVDADFNALTIGSCDPAMPCQMQGTDVMLLVLVLLPLLVLLVLLLVLLNFLLLLPLLLLLLLLVLLPFLLLLPLLLLLELLLSLP